MITKDDWNAALDAWVAGERERLGGPPRPEEIAAYVRGELPRAEASRVQSLLVYYPELTPFLTKKPRRRPAVLRYLPIAAVVALAFFMIPRRDAPFAIESKHELHAIELRGRGVAPPYELPLNEDRLVLAAFLSESPRDPAYRIEIIRNDERIWTSHDVQPTREGALEVAIPRGFLHAGLYRLDIYGVDRHGSYLRDSFLIHATK
jgi:hypothetical protein